jgi:hypothetical protein
MVKVSTGPLGRDEQAARQRTAQKNKSRIENKKERTGNKRLI